MITTETLPELRRACAALPRPLGLVPTMGFLHDGHLSLVRAAREECAAVAVSVFVNPTQFGPDEDFEDYPRDLERDLALLEEEGVDVVWNPPAETMYPPGFQTWVEVEEVSRPLEGAHRPGHFRGVTTVVTKLFNAFHPDRAYFGQKDAQQVVVIRRMVQDLHFPIQIRVCPIVREPDGLALSSRNMYLNPAQREAATVLYRSLQAAAEDYDSGEREAAALHHRMTEVLAEEPLAEPEYVSVAEPQTLQEIEGRVENALLSMAVYVGKTRLIDNMLVGEAELGRQPRSA